MELILLLLVPVVLGSLFISGGNDDDAAQTPPDDQAPEQATNTVNGTDEDEILRGSGAEDVIDGAGGDDLLFGNGGNDTMSGGDGSDFIDGGNGDDVLHGDAGDDVVAGGNGNDSMSGDVGDDILTGGAGDDTVNGDSGDDLVVGSTGADQLYGGLGDDVLDGASPTGGQSLADAFSGDIEDEFVNAAQGRYGEDATTADVNRFIRDFASDDGDPAPDALYGGAGEDWLIGDNGDTLTGGEDQDYFSVDWVSGNDAVTITDFNPVAEDFSVLVDANGETMPEFGIRDAADGSGVEVVVDGEVVATMAEATVSALNTDSIVMQLVNGDSWSVHSAVIMPSLAA